MEHLLPGVEEAVDQLFGNAACKAYDLRAIREIAQLRNIKLETVRNSSNQTILHVAAGYGRISLVSYLITQGADVNAQDVEGQAPLHYACNHAHNTISRMLIEAGANVNLTDNKGWSPLHFALARKDNAAKISPLYWEVVELLLDFGANPYIKSSSGQSCFSRIKDSDQRRCVRLAHLTSKLRNFNCDDQAGREAIIDRYLRVQDFFELVKIGDENYEVLETLITRRLLNSRLESFGNITPLHRAAGYNHLNVAKLLIKSGADVNAEDDHGRIPLHNAAQYGHVEMIELLTNEGSDINKRDREGLSPIHAAASNRTITACMELMGLGADISLRSKTGERPFDLAESNDVKEVLKISSESDQMMQVINEDPNEFHLERAHSDNLLPDEFVLRFIRKTMEDRKQSPSNQYTIKKIKLNEQGWRYQLIKRKMFDTIEVHVSESGARFSSYDIISIELILHAKVWKKYKYMCKRLEIEYGSGSKNERLLFHGSNFIDKIVSHGFDERYAKRKGMFGAGLYFAAHSSKSNQYTFGWNQGCQEHRDKCCFQCERKMICAQVALGRCLTSKDELQDYHHAPPGYSSVAGEPGPNLRYPEYAIYNGDQAYPLFVIRYRLKP